MLGGAARRLAVGRAGARVPAPALRHAARGGRRAPGPRRLSGRAPRRALELLLH